jgi:hypothetical protein
VNTGIRADRALRQRFHQALFSASVGQGITMPSDPTGKGQLLPSLSVTGHSWVMTAHNTQSADARRAAYLAAAVDLRKMAINAHSPEAQQNFMRLAVLYEELAEYSGGSTLGRPRQDEISKT